MLAGSLYAGEGSCGFDNVLGACAAPLDLSGVHLPEHLHTGEGRKYIQVLIHTPFIFLSVFQITLKHQSRVESKLVHRLQRVRLFSSCNFVHYSCFLEISLVWLPRVIFCFLASTHVSIFCFRACTTAVYLQQYCYISISCDTITGFSIRAFFVCL